jgi:hypothetical protein
LKDGFAILPFNYPEFQNFGPAASANFPTFFDEAKMSVWDPSTEQCSSTQFRDFTGVDSLTAFVASIIMYLFVHFLERNGPLFTIPGQTPYVKETEEENDDLKESDDSQTQDPSLSNMNGRKFFDENLETS